MYIDPVSGTLQSLNDTAGTLARMKDATVQNKIRQAELLNRMGENKAAEEMFNQAQNYGLSSLFAPDTQAWQAAGAFGDSPDPVQLKQLNSLSGAITPGATDISALNGNAITGISTKGIDKLTNKKAAKLDSYQKQEDKANQPIADYNSKAQAYNESIPQFRQSYEGDEPDQLNQLADDTMAYIKFAEKEGRYQDAAAAYNKYVQTGRSIADHYQHNFKPLGSEYFFGGRPKGGGGTGGEKTEDYNIIVNGKKIDITGIPRSILNAKDQNAALMKYKPELFKRLGITNPSQFNLEPSGKEGSGRLDDLQQTSVKEKEAELMRNAQIDAEMAMEKADTWGYQSTAEKVRRANAILGADHPYYYDNSGNLVKRAGSGNRNVVQSNPEDEVTF